MHMKVILPPADWDWIIMVMEEHGQGYVGTPITNDIKSQVYAQERIAMNGHA